MFVQQSFGVRCLCRWCLFLLNIAGVGPGEAGRRASLAQLSEEDLDQVLAAAKTGPPSSEKS